jgi:hypothetical protein
MSSSPRLAALPMAASTSQGAPARRKTSQATAAFPTAARPRCLRGGSRQLCRDAGCPGQFVPRAGSTGRRQRPPALPSLLVYPKAVHVSCQPRGPRRMARNLSQRKALHAVRAHGSSALPTCPCPAVGTLPMAGTQPCRKAKVRPGCGCGRAVLVAWTKRCRSMEAMRGS